MKKKVKLLIALVLIAVIAFGVYFIFGQGTDNKQIRAKAYALQNEIVVDEENIFEKTNNTINEMLALINAKGYDAGDEKTYFETYCEVLAYYNLVNKAILQNGLYVTNFNTGKSFNNMNSDYSKLVNVYKNGNEYLSETYYLITNDANYNVDYIKNFYNVFKDSLKHLNGFYYNATRAYVKGTQSSIDNDNLYKLKLENYAMLVNCYVNTFADETKIELNANLKTLILKASALVNNHSLNLYVENKGNVDALYNSKLDFAVVTDKYLAGTIEEYKAELKSEEEKLLVENYLNLVIGG